MTSPNVSRLSNTQGKSLWARAPVWRVCVSAAALSTVVVVCFPPKWREADVIPAPPLPEAVSYRSPQPAVGAPVSTPTPAVTEARAAVATPATVASATTRTKQAVPQNAAAATNLATRAPATAAISMAVPGAAAKPDISGLDGALLGRTYRQLIPVEGFNVPLPPGQWAVLANSSAHVRRASGMAYFLGRIEHKRLVGAIRLFALRSDDQPGAGFPAANGCTTGNPNLNYLYMDSVTAFDHQGCWLINNYFTPPLQQWADRAIKISALDRAAAGDLAAKGVTYPQDMVDVRFTRAETWGVLEVSYLFNPEVEGISSNTALSARESDWHAPNAPRFPAKAAYLAKMQVWGEEFWPKFQQAFGSGQPVSLLVKPEEPASQP